VDAKAHLHSLAGRRTLRLAREGRDQELDPGAAAQPREGIAPGEPHLPARVLEREPTELRDELLRERLGQGAALLGGPRLVRTRRRERSQGVGARAAGGDRPGARAGEHRGERLLVPRQRLRQIARDLDALQVVGLLEEREQRLLHPLAADEREDLAGREARGGLLGLALPLPLLQHPRHDLRRRHGGQGLPRFGAEEPGRRAQMRDAEVVLGIDLEERDLPEHRRGVLHHEALREIAQKGDGVAAGAARGLRATLVALQQELEPLDLLPPLLEGPLLLAPDGSAAALLLGLESAGDRAADEREQ
jgi:hypothetical protein